jgi:hypothetical protein
MQDRQINLLPFIERNAVPKDKIKFDVPLYTAYIAPYGFLDSNRESHALWNYYTMARAAYERNIKDMIVLEGDKDPTVNFEQLFTSVARMYGVEPVAMGKCWDLVDAQCDAIELPRMPNEDRYRMTSRVIEVRTNRSN